MSRVKKFQNVTQKKRLKSQQKTQKSRKFPTSFFTYKTKHFARIFARNLQWKIFVPTISFIGIKYLYFPFHTIIVVLI